MGGRCGYKWVIWVGGELLQRAALLINRRERREQRSRSALRSIQCSSEQRAAAHSGAENGVSGAERSNGEAAPAFVIPPRFSDFSSEGFAK